MQSERDHIAAAVADLGDRHAFEALLRRLDERALCFDPDRSHRNEVRQRIVGEQREKAA